MNAWTHAVHPGCFFYMQSGLFLDTDQQISQDSGQSACRDTGRENILHSFRKLTENVGNQFNAQSERETLGHHQRCLAVNPLGSNDPDTGSSHRTEHQQRSTSQYRFGHQ